MRLPEEFFEDHALDHIERWIEIAKDHHQDIETMPPSFSLVKDFELNQGEIALDCTLPIVLEETPEFWKVQIDKEIELHDNYLGLMLWCLIQNPKEEGSRYVFRLVMQKKDNPIACISDLNFKSLKSVDPFVIIPEIAFLEEF